MSLMHYIHNSIIITTTNGQRFCVETADTFLREKIVLPPAIDELKHITSLVHRSLPKLFKFFEHFDFAKSFMELENHKNELRDEKFIASLNTLQMELLFVSHLQTLMVLVYRTEEFSEDMKTSLLNDLSKFFKEVKADKGIFKTDVFSTIEALKRSNVKNFATQLSTEPAYFIGRLIYLKNLSNINDMISFMDSLKGTTIRCFSYLYGTTFIREISLMSNQLSAGHDIFSLS